MDQIRNCIICRKKPSGPGQITLHTRGVPVRCWMLECAKDENGDGEMPWLEHRVTVYGASHQETIDRWNDIQNLGEKVDVQDLDNYLPLDTGHKM